MVAINNLYLLLIFGICTFSTAQHLPKYIKPCRISDTDIDNCLIKHGNHALQVLLKGDKYLQIAPFTPIWIIPKLGGQLAEKVKFIETNTKISKFGDLKIVNATFNPEEMSLFFKTEIPLLKLTAKYNMDLELLGKQLSGRGYMNWTIENFRCFIRVYLKTETRGKFEYYTIDKSTFDIQAAKASFTFSNLSQRDGVQGEDANTFINKNWVDFASIVVKPWNEFLNGFTPKLFSKFTKMVPKDEFLLL